MWIPRALSPALTAAARQFPIVVLTGPRQVGKTSLLERLFPKHRYLSLDDASLAEMAETQPQAFLQAHTSPVILDEVQYAPGLFRYLKVAVDRAKNKNGQYLLTGSQSYLLMQGVSESLAGRAAIIPMLGLSMQEWLDFQGIEAAAIHSNNPWEFLFRGGFPALWATPENPLDRDRWFQSYISTYLERDLRALLRVGNLRDFERFLRACAARCAQTLNMSEIGRDVGISATTAREWISVLQASNMIFLLEPYYRSLGKRLVKSPKLYFTDTGLANYLMGFRSQENMRTSNQMGALWENHVITQWLRWRDWQVPAASLWYWRDQGGNEVDLLIELDGKLQAIEIKLTERPSVRELRGLRALKKFYGPESLASEQIACTAQQPFTVSEGVMAVPGWVPSL